MKNPEAWAIAKPLMSRGLFGDDKSNAEGDAASEAMSDEMMEAMLRYMPLRGPVSFQGNVSMADVQKVVDRLNALEQ